MYGIFEQIDMAPCRFFKENVLQFRGQFWLDVPNMLGTFMGMADEFLYALGLLPKMSSLLTNSRIENKPMTP